MYVLNVQNDQKFLGLEGEIGEVLLRSGGSDRDGEGEVGGVGSEFFGEGFDGLELVGLVDFWGGGGLFGGGEVDALLVTGNW